MKVTLVLRALYQGSRAPADRPHPHCILSVSVFFLFQFHSSSPSSFCVTGCLHVARNTWLSLVLAQGGVPETHLLMA